MIFHAIDELQLDGEEAWQVTRARLAKMLHKLPSEIEGEEDGLIQEFIEVMNADHDMEKRSK